MSHTARPALTRSAAKAITRDREELLPLALFCGSGLLLSVMLLIAEKMMFAAG